MRRIRLVSTILFLVGLVPSRASASDWVLDGTLPAPVAYHGVAVVAGNIFVFGGYNPPQEFANAYYYFPGGGYDESPSDLPAARHTMGFVNHQGVIYSIAGYLEGTGVWGRTVEVWSYNPTTDSWGSETSLSYHRAKNAAASVGDYLYTIGGHHEDTGHGFSLSRVERYNGSTWSSVASLKQDSTPAGLGRRQLGAAVVNGKIYAIGGLSYDRLHQPEHQFGGWLEVYDPVTNTWDDSLPPMPTPRGMFATAVVGSRIYTVGGYESPSYNVLVPSNAVEYFDVDDGTWHSEPPFPMALVGARAVAIDGNIYVLGGSNESTYFDTVYVMDGGGPSCGDSVCEAPETNATCPQDCYCGNGFVEIGEACDDGNASNNDDCLNACTLPTCGDGYVWNEGLGIEECDDAGESATCDADCTAADCGDGTLNETAGEVCDGLDNEECPNTDDGDGGDGPKLCRRDCTCAPPTCGDGVLHVGEQCDGEAQNEDGIGCDLKGCRSDCTCVLPKPRDPMPTEVTRLRSMGDIKRPRDLSASPRGRDSSGP